MFEGKNCQYDRVINCENIPFAKRLGINISNVLVKLVSLHSHFRNHSMDGILDLILLEIKILLSPLNTQEKRLNSNKFCKSLQPKVYKLYHSICSISVSKYIIQVVLLRSRQSVKPAGPQVQSLFLSVLKGFLQGLAAQRKGSFQIL